MKRLYLILSMLVALGTSWTAMAQQQCNPINIPSSMPWREDFTLTDWPYFNTQNGKYNLFSEYPENCWYVPDTIKADNGTISPRLWYNDEGNNRHLSIKEGSNTTKQDQIVALPVFSNPISTLSIQFKSKLNMTGTRTLKIGYYDTSTLAFTELKSISVSGNSDQLYGPYYFGAIANAPTTFNANYRLAFMLPANANGYSCDVKNIVITSTPTQITSVDDWNALCQAVNNGYTYSGKTVTLANDITISKMAGSSKTNSFKGTFDGQCHTITLSGGDFGTSSSPQSNADCAPFRFVAGATFLNLTVAGDIYSSNQRAGGFIGTAGHGDLTFTNCLSAVNIHASRSQNDGTHGGFIGLLQGDNQQYMTATFTGCAYTGRLSTTTSVDNVGGFIGWCEWRNEGSAKGYVTLHLNNCLVAMGATPNGETAINSGKTFVRCRNYTNSLGSNDANLNNCYCITLLGDAQGKQAYSVTAVSPATVAMSGSATEYNVSGITAYNTGFVYEGTIYAGEGDNVNLVLNGALDFVADHGTLTGSGSNYTLLMEAYNTEISRVSVCPKPTNVTLTNVMPTSATLNWEGEAERYNVRYGVIGDEVPSFFEDFENGLPSTWTTIDADGDGQNWYGHINTGSGNLTTHSGNGLVASESYNHELGILYPDNWLITPQLDLGGRMSVWLRGQENDYDYDEHFAIYLSLTDKNVDDFTIQLVPESITTNEYVEYTADLSAYSGQQGYIAIRHFNCNDKFILNVDDFYIYVRQETEWTNNATSSTNSLDITGLTPGTTYEFQVQAVCDEDNPSEWSAGASFTAPEACGAPNQLTAEVTGNAVELGWEGYQDGYNVRYRTSGFDGIYLYEPLTLPQIGDWEQQNMEYGGLAYTDEDEDETDVCFMFHFSSNPPQLLYSPYFTRPTQHSGTTLTFDYKVGSSDYPETFQVCYYDVDNNLLREETAIKVSNTDWAQYTGEVPVDASRFLIKYLSNDQWFLYLDNFIVYNADDNEVGEWMTATSDDNTLSLSFDELEFGTLYEWQVQGIDCDGEGGITSWSEVATFTTPEFYIKHIDPYTADGGYYLIASPLVDAVSPTAVNGMITDNLGANVDETTSTYDLYSFDQAAVLEWQNYRAGSFNLVNGQCYLYASKEGTDLVFIGAGNNGNTQDVTIHMTNAATGLDFPDWNLVGNPFATEDAYLDDSRAFYSMQNSGVFTPQSGAVAIKPMEGVFVVANSSEETLTFTTTQPNKHVAQLTLNLTKSGVSTLRPFEGPQGPQGSGTALLDRAIVRFDEGSQLPKLLFRKGSTQVYIPLEGKDYAVVRSEAMGSMPVSFKAEENGSYTLSFTTEAVSFAYLHLIDNMTGEDVDLLAGASTGSATYTFTAKTTDYESRFKLVFVCGDANDDNDFAFFSNGSFVINNEGNATLQVIDVNGRILKNESINGCANVNVKAAAGVYMLRLVNGNDVKVQKVVVR